MPAPLRTILTAEEDYTLTELRHVQSVPQRTRDRAHMLRLNAQGWNVPAIAEIFECHPHTATSDSATVGKTGIGGTMGSAGTGGKTFIGKPQTWTT